MSQINYTVEAPVAFPGMLGEGGKRYSISRASEAVADQGAGRPAVAGTDPTTQFLPPSGAGQPFLGITTAQQGREKLDTAGATSYQTDENVELLRQGRVWVTVEEAVVAGDPVFFRHTDNGPLLAGGWRNDAAAGEADQVVQAVFQTTAAIDTVALIDINLP